MKKTNASPIIAGTAQRQRFIGLRHFLTNKTHILWGIAGIAGMVIIGIGVWWLQFAGEPSDLHPPVAIGNGYEKSLHDLQAQPVPKEPLDQMYYYSQLGQNNMALQRYDVALKHYIKAQEIVDSNNLSQRASFYAVIAEAHEKLGHKIEASIYRKRADDRVKTADDIEPTTTTEGTWE